MKSVICIHLFIINIFKNNHKQIKLYKDLIIFVIMIGRFKRFVALLMMFTAFIYSLDIHGLSHAINDIHIDDGQNCELCIINNQKYQDVYALTPSSQSFSLICPHNYLSINFSPKLEKDTIQNLFLEGQLFNRPPPTTYV